MRIVVAGSGKLAAGLLRVLSRSSHEIVGIIQNGRTTGPIKRHIATAGSGFFAKNSSVLGIAVRDRLPVVWIDRMTPEELAPLKALDPDLLLVAGFGIILKEPILRIPKVGCVNVHSSLLPRHRGPNPFSAAILAGETESGVTFHIVDTGIDTGAILEQYAFPLNDDDTSLSIYDKACTLAAEHTVEVMDRIARDGLHGTVQDETQACYDQKLTAEDALIDWRQPARELHRLWRACKPFRLPRFTFRGHSVFVSQLVFNETPVTEAPGTVLAMDLCVKVATGKGSLTIVTAYSVRPFPWAWPSLWSKPRVGDKLE